MALTISAPTRLASSDVTRDLLQPVEQQPRQKLFHVIRRSRVPALEQRASSSPRRRRVGSRSIFGRHRSSPTCRRRRPPVWRFDVHHRRHPRRQEFRFDRNEAALPEPYKGRARAGAAVLLQRAIEHFQPRVP